MRIYIHRIFEQGVITLFDKQITRVVLLSANIFQYECFINNGLHY